MREPTILIVDDQAVNVELLETMLSRVGYERLVSTTNPHRALGLYRQHEPDLVLLDLIMPELGGLELFALLKAAALPDDYCPVVILTADVNPEVKRRALELGVNDFITKPFDISEVLLRIRTLLRTRALHLQLKEASRTLEHKVTLRTRELEGAQIEMLERLARAAEYRDDATGEHTRRVGDAAAVVATALGVEAEEAETIRRAARLHDVGKIGIPDSILLKPGRLEPAEFALMQTHTTIGAELLSGGNSSLLQLAEEIALTHHERFDGCGYPEGLKGESIPLAGRIVAITDVFDALTHVRPYKPAWSRTEALAEIARSGGSAFDPQVVAAFLALQERGRL